MMLSNGIMFGQNKELYLQKKKKKKKRKKTKQNNNNNKNKRSMNARREIAKKHIEQNSSKLSECFYKTAQLNLESTRLLPSYQ